MSLLSRFGFFLLCVSPALWAGERVVPAIIEKAGVSERVLGVVPAPLPGWQQVWLRGGKIVFVSDDGRYLVQGALIENTPAGLVDLTAQREGVARRMELEQLPAEHFVTYKASGEMKSYITVFTDVGCPFCQKFHHEVKALTEQGIGVRYLPFPRAGINSEDYRHLVSVWCSDDRQNMLERGYKGRRLSAKTCAGHGVDESYRLGQLMGVAGTPTIIFADGSMNVGYLSADAILKRLGIEQK